MAAPDRRLAERYERIAAQLAELFVANRDPIARMATMVALLHHKMPHFFWTGFYRLIGEDLVVGPYQGPVACQVLDREKGVCRAGVTRNETVLVPDVEAFPGHIPCDARSKSEIVLPVRDADGAVIGVLDVDSDKIDAFDSIDAEYLERIVALLK